MHAAPPIAVGKLLRARPGAQGVSLPRRLQRLKRVVDEESADTGAADTGAADAGAADTGAADTGAADTGAADTGTADTGAADTGAADTGATDTGAADTGAADSGAAVTGAADTGAADSGAADTGAADTEAADTGEATAVAAAEAPGEVPVVGLEDVGEGEVAPKDGVAPMATDGPEGVEEGAGAGTAVSLEDPATAAKTADTGAADSGATDTGAADTEAADTGAADTGAVDTGSTDTGAADTGAADTGAADTGAADTGAADTGAVATGAADTGAADTGAADTGAVDTGAAHTGEVFPLEVACGAVLAAGLPSAPADAAIADRGLPLAEPQTMPADCVSSERVGLAALDALCDLSRALSDACLLSPAPVSLPDSTSEDSSGLDASWLDSLPSTAFRPPRHASSARADGWSAALSGAQLSLQLLALRRCADALAQVSAEQAKQGGPEASGPGANDPAPDLEAQLPPFARLVDGLRAQAAAEKLARSCCAFAA
ncbi:hypothetical protein T492DRAFT_895338 [Pavlovales sp. CCMP2436]|nr:hypothetical protein T492DRAFT_895338 [Pavlovales sp. CCMP2436]